MMKRLDWTAALAWTRTPTGALGVIISSALIGGVAGCGGDEDGGGARRPDGGSAAGTGGGSMGGAGASGGSAGNGGSGGTTGGSGGASGGSGGSAAGAGGSGGTGPDASTGCPPPSDPSAATLCVSIEPETITFESDPRLDGSGVLVLEVFDVAVPPDDPLAELGTSLASVLLPDDAQSGGEVALDAVRQLEVTVPDAPSTVYLRAVFFDNPDAFQGTGLTAGTWIGGLDLTGGFVENQALSPVAIDVGAGNDVRLDLYALRELFVTVDASATPVGDGEGPLLLLVTDGSDLQGDPAVFGFQALPCVDVGNLPDTFVVPSLGLGDPLYVTGLFNDLGLAGDFPPGSLGAVDVDVEAGTGSIPATVSMGTDYTPSVSIDLSFANPWPADAGAVPPNACADLATDGGAP